MANRKTKDEKNVISVRWNGSTYIASLDGERTSSTASPFLAARRLAASVLAVPPDKVSLIKLEECLVGISKYQIAN